MTKELLKEMRQDFENLMADFDLDNLSSPYLVERALILEKTLIADMDKRSGYLI